MVGFVIGVVILLIAIALLIAAAKASKKLKKGDFTSSSDQEGYSALKWVGRIVGALALIGSFLLLLFSMLFTQDVGDASTLRSVTGEVVGYETQPGVHVKPFWVDAVTFNVRNQRVVYVNPKHSTGDNSGGQADGREINVNDQDGVATDVDVTIRYSIDPSQVNTIYRNFKTEDGLKSILLFNDLRDAVRAEAGSLHTIQVLSDHPKYAAGVRDILEGKWTKYGVSIDEVSIQQTVPPKSVAAAYAVAQQSQIEVQKAQNDLNATKVSAQQKVVQAQAVADANDILTKSLTPQILQQKYIDALGAGTVYVVPAGSTPFVGVAK